jgi:formylmethanofuran dehydrogenase subunit B
VTVERLGDAVRLDPPCILGAEWFGQRVRQLMSAPAATVHGQPSDLETALNRAAQLLRSARRPLLHGFDAATVEDARAAVALADRLGALITTGRAADAWPGVTATSLRGASTATIGEIRDRSQTVVIWREDPIRTHPRLLARLRLDGSRSERAAERTLIVVDDRDTATAQLADERILLAKQRDFQALTRLHAMQQGLALTTSDPGADLKRLLECLERVPHAAFVYGPGLTAGTGGQRRALALHELVRALCHDRHVVTLALPGSTGVTGAQDVLAWQTGYAGSVDLASGHPELVTATDPLEEGEGVDVSLLIEGAPDALAPRSTGIALCSLPVPRAEVSIRTAAAGVASGGTAHRLDGVPLQLQAPLPGDDAPTAATLLTRLLAELER